MTAAEKILPVSVPAAAMDHLAAASRLESSRSTIEKSFLDMGQRLMGCHQMLLELSGAYQGMPAALQGDELASAIALLDMLRSQARHISGQQDIEGTRIDELSTMAEGLNDPIDLMRREIRNLGFVTTNARIVAAGISEHRADFDNFAVDMIELGKSAESIVADFSRSHTKLVRALTSASTANRAFRQQHGATLAIVSGRLDEHLEVIEGHKRHAVADMEESRRLTQQISARIGQAVSALQIGDITRQRLERVEESLRELCAVGANAATQSSVLRIQALQLESTSADFVQEVSGFAEALRSLASDARAVMDDSAANSEALLARGARALAGLAEQLQVMILMLSDFAAMQTRLHDLRDEVKSCLLAMQDRMHAIRELEHSMRLLSINTAVRCARFGEEGHALRVVAQQMRQLSSDAVAAATTVTVELERSKDTLSDTGAESMADCASAQSLVDDARAAIGTIETVVERMRAHAAVIARSGPQTARLIQEAADVSHTYVHSADDWCDLIEDLGKASAAGSADATELDADLLARMRGRYTMASERLIHDEALADIDTAPAPDAPLDAIPPDPN